MIDLTRAMNSFLQRNDKQKAIHALLTFPKAMRCRDTRKYHYTLKSRCKGPKIWKFSEIFISEHLQCQEVDAFIFSNLCGPQPWAGSHLCIERK